MCDGIDVPKISVEMLLWMLNDTCSLDVEEATMGFAYDLHVNTRYI